LKAFSPVFILSISYTFREAVLFTSGPPAHRALTASGCCRRSPYQVKSTDSERTVATPNKNLPSETAEGCVEKPQDDMRRNWMCFLLQKVQRSGVFGRVRRGGNYFFLEDVQKWYKKDEISI